MNSFASELGYCYVFMNVVVKFVLCTVRGIWSQDLFTKLDQLLGCLVTRLRVHTQWLAPLQRTLDWHASGLQKYSNIAMKYWDKIWIGSLCTNLMHFTYLIKEGKKPNLVCKDRHRNKTNFTSFHWIVIFFKFLFLIEIFGILRTCNSSVCFSHFSTILELKIWCVVDSAS